MAGTHKLPGRIALAMAGTVAIFVLTVAASILWMGRAMDRDARAHSVALMQAAASGLLRQIEGTTLDYAKWDEAVLRAEAGDEAWFYENVGNTAKMGIIAHLIVLHGGPLARELGWTDDAFERARAGVLAPGDLAWLDAALDEVPLGERRAVTRFVRREGRVFAVATARIEPGTDLLPRPAGEPARLIMGVLVNEKVVAELAGQTFLGGLRLTTTLPPDGMALPLPGPYDAPAGFIAWDAPAPGTALLRRMVAPVLLMLALATALAGTGVVLARRSARALVRAETRSSLAARTDPLTGLPNRAAFGEALAPAARPGERAVVFLDLNGFKRVNDSIGHAAGDRVIAEVGARLAPLCDAGTRLARIGGDEFVFVLAGPGADGRAEWLAQAVERALVPPLDVMGHRLRLGAAIGWAAQDDEATPGEVLVHRADLAMAEAKRRREGLAAGDGGGARGSAGGGDGGGPVAWDALIEEADRDARAIEGALREALGRPGQIWVAYQPIAPVAREGAPLRLHRAEALARWTSPSLGSVPPDRFIAVAERSGLVIELGRRILEVVCADLRAHPGLSASINVSPRQLVAPTFVPELIAACASHGIAPSRLEVELTEQLVVDDPQLAARCLRDLHEAGFTTALDDFGTGYSSLGTLTQMEFDVVKIDRSFVSGFPGDPRRLALLDALIQAAHALGLAVVCEGIETAEEMDLLGDLSCDLAQGWHLDRPMAIEALAARWLAPEEARAETA